jgi:hypothetical protein
VEKEHARITPQVLGRAGVSSPVPSFIVNLNSVILLAAWSPGDTPLPRSEGSLEIEVWQVQKPHF